MMMGSSPLSSGRKFNMPSPYDAPLQGGLDRTQAKRMALEPHLQHQHEISSPPPPQPRLGSTQAIIQQRKQLDQDVFEKQNVQQSNMQRSALEVPQKAPSVLGQLQQLANSTRQFLNQLDRLNQSDLSQRQAQGIQLRSDEGRHQEHHQNATLYMRLKEPSVVTKSRREEDVARRKAKQARLGIKGKDARSTTHRNLAADQEEEWLEPLL